MKKRCFEVGIVLLSIILLYGIAAYKGDVGEFQEKAGHEYSGLIIGKRNVKESDTGPIEDSEPIETLEFIEDLALTEDTKTDPIESIETARENAVRGYNEFLDNERSIGAINVEELYIPTGEPDRRYATDYVIYDIDGDDIPELHVQNGRYYYIFTYKKGEFYRLKTFFSDPSQYGITSDGTFVYWDSSWIERSDYWCFFTLDSEGNETDLAWFCRIEINENDYYDEDDIFMVNGTECTMGEWIENSREYLYTDENGWEHIRNMVEWTVLCEKKW